MTLFHRNLSVTSTLPNLHCAEMYYLLLIRELNSRTKSYSDPTLVITRSNNCLTVWYRVVGHAATIRSEATIDFDHAGSHARHPISYARFPTTSDQPREERSRPSVIRSRANRARRDRRRAR